MLLKLVQAGKLQPAQLITHRKSHSGSISQIFLLTGGTGFKLSEMDKAYETFGDASKHGALKVVIDVE